MRYVLKCLFWNHAVAHTGNLKTTEQIQIANIDCLLSKLNGYYFENQVGHEQLSHCLLSYWAIFGYFWIFWMPAVATRGFIAKSQELCEDEKEIKILFASKYEPLIE